MTQIINDNLQFVARCVFCNTQACCHAPVTASFLFTLTELYLDDFQANVYISFLVQIVVAVFLTSLIVISDQTPPKKKNLLSYIYNSATILVYVSRYRTTYIDIARYLHDYYYFFLIWYVAYAW